MNKNTAEIILREEILVPTKNVKLLGITIDEYLNFNDHITKICKSAAKQLNVLKRLSKFVNMETRMVINKTFIMSYFNYRAVVSHFCGKVNSDKLQNMKVRALRYVFNDYVSSSDVLLRKAGSDILLIYRLRQVAIEVFKCINKISPPYLYNLFEKKDIMYNLKDSNRLMQPEFNTYMYGYRSLRYIGSKVFNNLSNEFKQNINLKQFKELIRTWSGLNCKCNYCCKMY